MMNLVLCFFLFKQKTAYEMRISDWSSDVCSSDLRIAFPLRDGIGGLAQHVLDHRDFERLGIIIGRDLDARQGHVLLARRLGGEAGVIAPLTRANLEMTFVAVGADDHRYDNAALDDRRKNVGHIGRLLALPHISLRYGKPVDCDVLNLHVTYSTFV